MLKILKDNKALAIDKDLLKTSLCIDHDDTSYDTLIEHAIRKATVYVEEYTQRTIMLKTLQYTSFNNVVYLPKPMIYKVLEVKANDKILTPDSYKKELVLDTMKVVLKEEYKDQEIIITYEAGYGENIDDIPPMLSYVIFDCAKILFEQGHVTNADHSNQFIQSMKDILNCTQLTKKTFIADKDLINGQ